MIDVADIFPGFTAPAEPLAFTVGTYRVPTAPLCAWRNIVLADTLGGAVPKRQVEFLAGRCCAARALERLGVSSGPLPIGARGEPVWPAGVTGSISHSDGTVMCVAGRRTDFRGLGIDIEHLGNRADAVAMAQIIGTESEFDLLAPFWDFPMAFTLLFSAKEAVYKAIHGVAGRIVEFDEMECFGATPSALRFRPRPPLSGMAGFDRQFDVSLMVTERSCTTFCAW